MTRFRSHCFDMCVATYAAALPLEQRLHTPLLQRQCPAVPSHSKADLNPALLFAAFAAGRDLSGWRLPPDASA